MSSHLSMATSISFSKVTLLHRQGFIQRFSSPVQAKSAQACAKPPCSGSRLPRHNTPRQRQRVLQWQCHDDTLFVSSPTSQHALLLPAGITMLSARCQTHLCLQSLSVAACAALTVGL